MSLSPRTRRAGIVAVVLLGLYAAIGFLVLPPIVRSQAEKRMSSELGRKVSIGRVGLNPFLLSATVENLDIQERDGSGSFAGWARLYVRFDLLRSLFGEWVLGAVELDGFHAGVVLNQDRSFNFSDLLAKFTAPSTEQAKPARPVLVGRLAVSGARVAFADNSLKHPFKTQVGPLAFTLESFRTSGSRGAPYQLRAETESGERLTWTGTLAADPVSSRGQFSVDGLILKKYSPYLEGRTLADLAGGLLDLSGTYEINLDPKARTLVLSGSELHVRDLKIVDRRTGNVTAALKALDVTGIAADAVTLSGSVDRVAVSGGRLAVRRGVDGSIDVLALAAFGGGPPPGTGGATAPKVRAREVAVQGVSVDLVDDAVPHAAHLSLAGLSASLRDFTLADGAVMPLHVSFDWVPKGDVVVDGTVSLRPTVKVDLKANVTAFDVRPLSPYVEQFVAARLADGAVTVSGSAHASLAAGAPAAAFQGDLAVDRLDIVDAAQGKDMAGFSRLSVKGIDLSTSPRLSAVIGRVEVTHPFIHARIYADKTLNLTAAAAPAGARVVQAAGPPGAAAALLPRVEVGGVAVTDGEFSFSDHSVEPSVHLAVTNFSGTLSGLSSENPERADVDLKGLVGGAGPVAIRGKLDPLGARKYIGLTVSVAGVDLVPMSPYSGKFAGYELARGQLVVDSRILVDGDKVDAANVVTLNQFTFGAATSSPDATALPVRLGIALLKDTDGRVVVDLPVQGSLADPEFRIGRVVLRVIVNLLTKAAVSPFSLIGSMFGGGGEELAFQEFAPGSSELQAKELPKLETLAKALSNRPSLNLGIQGGFDASADAYALRRLKLEADVRRRIWAERHAADPNIPPPAEFTVSQQEYGAMVKKLFDAKFPPGTQFGTPLPPPPSVAPPPAGPPPGILRRLVDVVTFKRQRAESEARKESEKAEAQHQTEVAAAVAKGLPVDEMAGRLAEATEVTPGDLSGLAAARAERVRNQLVTSGKIAPGRLFLAKVPDLPGHGGGPRVFLTLQ